MIYTDDTFNWTKYFLEIKICPKSLQANDITRIYFNEIFLTKISSPLETDFLNEIYIIQEVKAAFSSSSLHAFLKLSQLSELEIHYNLPLAKI